MNQRRILATAREFGVVVVAHSPFARGQVLNNPVLGEIAAEAGRSVAQVALRWLVQQDGVAAIPGGSPQRLGEVCENLGALEFTLTDAQMARIAGLTTRSASWTATTLPRGTSSDQIDRRAA